MITRTSDGGLLEIRLHEEAIPGDLCADVYGARYAWLGSGGNTILEWGEGCWAPTEDDKIFLRIQSNDIDQSVIEQTVTKSIFDTTAAFQDNHFQYVTNDHWYQVNSGEMNLLQLCKKMSQPGDPEAFIRGLYDDDQVSFYRNDLLGVGEYMIVKVGIKTLHQRTIAFAKTLETCQYLAVTPELYDLGIKVRD